MRTPKLERAIMLGVHDCVPVFYKIIEDRSTFPTADQEHALMSLPSIKTICPFLALPVYV